jgi:Antibiotic biosynthesis monooxygenase
MKLGRTLVIGTVAGLALAFVGRFHSQAESPQNPPPQQKGQGGMPDLVGPLKATPGCLGVEVARTQSGKQLIFAWFENKAAVMSWYDSDLHQAMMTRFFDGEPEHGPMEKIADNEGPLLVIASVTPAKPGDKGAAGPFAQIAIELYKPLPGGAAVGGRFAPSTIKVDGFREYSPEASSKESARDPEKKP